MKPGTILSRLITVAILCFSFAFFTVSPVFAIDDATDDAASPSDDIDGLAEEESDEDLLSSFKNPAQAAHASNLADKAASRGDEETADRLEDVEEAEEGLDEAMATDDPEAIEEATQALEDAEEAYATAVAELTGVITRDLIDMREAGMGWGNIAQELGVHPGVLGLGHTKGKQKHKAEMYAGPRDGVVAGSIQASEVAEATARNTRSGYARGHGLAMNTGVDSQTSAAGFGGVSKSKGKSMGHGGASGLGSGQGQAGNSGNRGGSSDSGGSSSASSSPGKSGKSNNSSSTNRGGAGVAGVDGNPGGGNSGNSNNGHGSSKGKSNNGKSNNGKSGDRGNSKR